jgi:2-polyprenyl-3-methyl-5-hydroxy-6-metoxy-1,4-benzoquinol methylase
MLRELFSRYALSVEVPQYEYVESGEISSNSYLLPELRACLQQCKQPVLDLGCGNGWISRELLSDGLDVYGADASASGVQIANSLAPGRFFQLDVQSRQLPPELAAIPFNTVISTEVIEHLYDPRGFVDFARQILGSHGQTDGKLIVTTPYHGYLKNLLLALTGNMDAHFTALWDGGHIKFFSRATLESLLRERGFVVEGFCGAGRLPYLWKSMVMAARVV